MIAEIEAEAFAVDRMLTGWNPENASATYLNWKYRQVFIPDRDPDLAQATLLVTAYQAPLPDLDEATRLQHGLYVKLTTAHAVLGNVQTLRELGERLLVRAFLVDKLAEIQVLDYQLIQKVLQPTVIEGRGYTHRNFSFLKDMGADID